ncbi:MAG: exodeoxyribonuclease V subunit beta, partial [Desulfobacterium sp.]|nr:exodeoxyribonuclease V subunit beta [Desulfobacterium sp.]
FSKMISSWSEVRSEIGEILLKHEGLNRNKYRTSTLIPLIEGMDTLSRSTASAPLLFPGFEKFTTESIQGAVKKGHVFPEHDFFHLCSDLQDIQNQLDIIHNEKLIQLKIDFFHYVRKESAKRKKQKNFRSFDDLLLDCYQALETKSSTGDLIVSLRNRYAAALIDEFQDTDPVQYTIFQRIFGDPSQSILFLIGDPKQAIYSFRGADIFAYMKAAAGIENQYTLNTNWRSREKLVQAVNTIFDNVKTPFVYNDIQYQKVDAAPVHAEKEDSVQIHGQKTAPFHLWILESADGKPITKNTAYQLIPDAVAGEISRLLNDVSEPDSIRGKKITAGDIAVLVRKNREAALVQKALARLRIPSVIFSSDSIFDSFEAFELERILAAIVSPGREEKIRSALTTEMLGYQAKDLIELFQSEKLYEERFSSFMEYHLLWEKQGFLRMFTQLCRIEKIQERVMQYRDGERRYTNIRHLTELIHQAGILDKKGMNELLAWFQKQKESGHDQLDEHQLRLESDENAVKLITIHKSKGLEYPVVFCPFTWESSKIKNSAEMISFHDAESQMKLTLDFGSEKQSDHLSRAEKENLSENLRLLYVALTRAKDICYLVWGRFANAESSAPGYLFHFAETDDESALTRNFKTVDDQALLSELDQRLKISDSVLQISKMSTGPGIPYSPPETGNQQLQCRSFTARIRNSRKFTSFSSLIHSYHEEMNLSGYLQKGEDDFPISISPEAPPTKDRFDDIHLFPRGAVPGTCLHEMLEHLDFSDPDPASVQALIQEKLVLYGFHPDWTKSLYAMIVRLLNTPLDKDYPELTLSRLRPKDRINELAFCFPIQAVTAKKMEDVFQNHPGPCISKEFTDRIGKLEFGRIDGFMKGFMDLVFQYEERFYIVDWKSNHLGNQDEDYSSAALQDIMEKDLYLLQYHIYTVALDRYLKQRLPGYTYEKNFGGVFYLFLRGFGSPENKHNGIFKDVPSKKRIEELSVLLTDSGKKG